MHCNGAGNLIPPCNNQNHRSGDKALSAFKLDQWPGGILEVKKVSSARLTWRNCKLRTIAARMRVPWKGNVSKYIIYYGDWSKKNQMPGCDPSLVMGLRGSEEVLCNGREWAQDLQNKQLVDGWILMLYEKRSYSRLCCVNCRCPKYCFQVVHERALNAAAMLVRMTLPAKARGPEEDKTGQEKGISDCSNMQSLLLDHTSCTQQKLCCCCT